MRLPRHHLLEKGFLLSCCAWWHKKCQTTLSSQARKPFAIAKLSPSARASRPEMNEPPSSPSCGRSNEYLSNTTTEGLSCDTIVGVDVAIAAVADGV